MSEVPPSKAPGSWKHWLANLVIFVVSIIFTYTVVGSLFLRFAPGLTPALSSQVPMAANLWWQPSAPDPSSNDYLALLGDSYAEGVGDWKAQQIDFTSPSHSADVIHDLTGRNILSYGRRGASSAEGLVRLPALALGAGECLFFPSLRPPQEIVYYFYEGNDLEDNIDFMNRRLGLGVGDVGVSNASIKFLEKNWGTPGRNPCFLYFGKSIKSFIKTARETFFPPPDVNNNGTETPPAANRALIGTEVVALPAALQGPGLDLDEQSVAAAFEVFDVSLMWLRQTLPDIKITVVHLPSVLSTYNLAGPSVTVEVPDKSSTVHSSLDVASRSDEICRRLRDITLGSGAHFFDARPSMRELGTREIIHGPRDWTHFNRAGYTRLGETVAAALMDKAPSDHCGRLSNIEH
jgi:hypothetical protein